MTTRRGDAVIKQPDGREVERYAASGSGERGHLHLYLGVDDVDSFGERLRAAGIELIQPPCDTDWGTRELVFHDDQGHTIYARMRVSAANKPVDGTHES